MKIRISSNAYTKLQGQLFVQVEDGRAGKYMPQGIIDFVNDTGENYVQNKIIPIGTFILTSFSGIRRKQAGSV